MADRHLVRYQQLIQEQLSSLMMRELDLEPGILVTISKVIVSADLQVADVKITVFPTDKQGTVLQQFLYLIGFEGFGVYVKSKLRSSASG